MSAYFRVTLHRSTIGLSQKTRLIVKSLKLGKRMTTSYLPQTPAIAGSILKIKELVQVENVILEKGVTPKLALRNEKLARKPFLGYEVIGNALQKNWDS
ncbi:39S ribosomal protein L33, mitochondrial [Coelomomyces lativittatus]|nr:39S ribosomal protein L33, mitochondrial [Coelomomyces lativittatus]KAJ1502541.1 39S ribosomal protein L33, mitochondrial [Coelomomyces lativittatus]KAJ1504542.1 39S ribosomal protein L33, mitochondrial [Coelomomyces lativittatus]